MCDCVCALENYQVLFLAKIFWHFRIIGQFKTGASCRADTEDDDDDGFLLWQAQEDPASRGRGEVSIFREKERETNFLVRNLPRSSSFSS